MKIAIVGQRYNPYIQNKILGGAEMVEKTHLKLLSVENDVFFITSANSEDVEFPGVETKRVSQDSVFFSDAEKDAKRRYQDVRQILETIKPDMIIVHDNLNGKLLAAIDNISPSLVFMHDVAGVSGLLSISYANTYIKAAEKHLVVGVSNQSNKDWNTFIQKTALIPVKHEFDTFLLQPVMWKRHELSNVTHKRGVTVGRLVKQKKHKTTCDVFAASGLPLDFFHMGAKNTDEEELLSKLHYANFHVSIPYTQLMNHLNESMCLAICGEESFGLTAFEANSHGVPVVLLSKKDHPVQEATVPLGLVKCSSKEEMIDYLRYMEPISMNQRMEIRELMYDKFSETMALARLDVLFKKAKEKFKKESTLDEFFG